MLKIPYSEKTKIRLKDPTKIPLLRRKQNKTFPGSPTNGEETNDLEANIQGLLETAVFVLQISTPEMQL